MRTLHMMLSVDAARWSDEMLDGYLAEVLEDGSTRSLSGPEVRAHLLDLKARGFKVVPNCDNCDPKTGECLGHERMQP